MRFRQFRLFACTFLILLCAEWATCLRFAKRDDGSCQGFLIPKDADKQFFTELLSPKDIGTAYDSTRDIYLPATGGKSKTCLTNFKITEYGQGSATISVERSQDFRKSVDTIVVGASVKIDLFLFSIEWRARFVTELVSSSLSDTILYTATYTLPPKVLDDVDYSKTGGITGDADTALKSGSTEWSKECGDQFVYEQVKGAKIYIGLKVGFSSPSDREAASVQIDNGGSDVQSLVDSYTNSDFSNGESVQFGFVINAIGGNQQALLDFKKHPETRRLYCSCVKQISANGEKATDCKELITRFINWARDEFAAKLTYDNTVVISQKHLPYKYLNIKAPNPPPVPLKVKVQRSALRVLVNRNANWTTLYGGWADQLPFKGTDGEDPKDLVKTLLRDLDQNREMLDEIVKLCYDSFVNSEAGIEACVAGVESAKNNLKIPADDLLTDGLPGFALKMRLSALSTGQQTMLKNGPLLEIPGISWGNGTKPFFSARAFLSKVTTTDGQQYGTAFVFGSKAVVYQDGPILNRYMQAINEGSVNLRYGFPVADPKPFTAGEEKGTIASLSYRNQKTAFEVTSAIYRKPNQNALALSGPCFVKYNSSANIAAELGFPTSEIKFIVKSNQEIDSGRVCEFEKGVIYYEAGVNKRAPVAVYGNVFAEFKQRGGFGGELGVPITDVIDLVGQQLGVFSKGIIFRPKTGSKDVFAIGPLFAPRWEGSDLITQLGGPIAATECAEWGCKFDNAPDNCEKVNLCTQRFERGVMYAIQSGQETQLNQSPQSSQSIATYGRIFEQKVNNRIYDYGIPSGDPKDFNPPFHSNGSYQIFGETNRVVFAASGTDRSFSSEDAIARHWLQDLATGTGNVSKLGFPISDVVTAERRQMQRFEGGGMVTLSKDEANSLFYVYPPHWTFWESRRNSERKDIPESLGWPLANYTSKSGDGASQIQGLQFFEKAVRYTFQGDRPVVVEGPFYSGYLGKPAALPSTQESASALEENAVKIFGYPSGDAESFRNGDVEYVRQSFTGNKVILGIPPKPCQGEDAPLWRCTQGLEKFAILRSRTVDEWTRKQTELGAPYFLRSESAPGRITVGGAPGADASETDVDIGSARGVIYEFAKGYLVYYSPISGVLQKNPTLTNGTDSLRTDFANQWYTHRKELGIPTGAFDSQRNRQDCEFGSLQLQDKPGQPEEGPKEKEWVAIKMAS